MYSIELAYPCLIVIAGPAGSGKSTLCDRLIVEDPSFSRVITTTTRTPRATEKNGVHYHFFSPEEFSAKKKRGEFIETATIHGEAGEMDRQYGTLRESVYRPLRSGQNLVMNIDTQGVKAFRDLANEDESIRRSLHTVFVYAHMPTLIERMRLRYASDHGIEVHKMNPTHNAEIARRIITAEHELREMGSFDTIIESRSREEDFQKLMKAVRTHQRGLTLRMSER